VLKSSEKAGEVEPSHNWRPASQRYGFFGTTLPFSHTWIGVPYIRAIFRARHTAAGIARFTDSKNRLFSPDVFVLFMVPLR
jgi:hypothetical protein